MTRFVLIGATILMIGLMVSYGLTHSSQSTDASLDSSVDIAPTKSSTMTMDSTVMNGQHSSWMHRLEKGWHQMLAMLSGSQEMAHMGMGRNGEMTERWGSNHSESYPMTDVESHPMDRRSMGMHSMGEPGSMMGSGNGHPMGTNSMMNGPMMNGPMMNGSRMNGSRMNDSGMNGPMMDGSGRSSSGMSGPMMSGSGMNSFGSMMDDGILGAIGSILDAFTGGHGGGHGMMR